MPGDSVCSIYKDRLENIWAGTSRGLGLFNPLTEKFTVFRHEYGNPHSLIDNDIRKYIAAFFSNNYRIITAANGKGGVFQRGV